MGEKTILAFATKGSGTNDEHRLRALLSNLETTLVPFDKGVKFTSFRKLLSTFRNTPPTLIVMEGTGIAGGIACLLARFLWGHRYVFSSGDAVGPFVGAHVWGLGIPFGLYERMLCRYSAGFIGWTPYLVGRALTFGAPRGMTAAGWVLGQNVSDLKTARRLVRALWGIREETIVFGLAGAIVRNKRRRYCYGLELVRAIRRVDRDDIAVVIIGDGTGLETLRREAGNDLGKRIFLPGSVPLDGVMESLCGFDVASLPQSTDDVGAFRYTTKISEYQALKLPVLVSRIPAAYDLDEGQFIRLPGSAPWDPIFVKGIADYMERVTQPSLQREIVPSVDHHDDTFSRETQVNRVTAFVKELFEEASW